MGVGGGWVGGGVELIHAPGKTPTGLLLVKDSHGPTKKALTDKAATG